MRIRFTYFMGKCFDHADIKHIDNIDCFLWMLDVVSLQDFVLSIDHDDFYIEIS